MSTVRRTRTELILRLINLLKSEELANKQIFQQVELTTLEAALKDDLGRHPWFNSLINTVVSEACPVSQEELDLYSATGAGFNPAEYEEVKEEVHHLDTNIKKLKFQMEFLQERFDQLVDLKESEAKRTTDTKLITAELRLKHTLAEVQKFVDKDSAIHDPYKNVAQLAEKATQYFKEVSQLDRDRLLDSLTLSSYSQSQQDVLQRFLHRLELLFVRIQDKLEKFKDHCDKLGTYFGVNVKKDILWRKEIETFMKELEGHDSSILCTNTSERPASPREIPDIEACWGTIQEIISLNRKYTDYTEKLNHLTDQIKGMIDLSLNPKR